MHPDAEITQRYRDQMRAIAGALDQALNGDARPKHTAFVLLITEFDNMAGRVNYISNGGRADVVTMLKEITARFEGQAEAKGSA
jgi:Mor family transcriptional regulator